jgi:hypothetical protein
MNTSQAVERSGTTTAPGGAGLSLRPDIKATRQMISRVVDSLAGDPAERAMIAAKAAYEFITLDQGTGPADAAFTAVLADPSRTEVPVR